MSIFNGGGVPSPDYDSDDINYVDQKTEFTDDVFVYGKLYADLGGDVQTFSTAGVERVRITKEGDVAIGSKNPNVVVDASNTSILAVGIVTAREYYGVFKGSIDASVANDKISEGNSEAEVVDTGTNGHFKVTTEGVERFRITSDGQLGLSVTPDTWSTGKGLTIGTSQATLWGTGDQINLSGNAYFNSGWKAAATKAGASQIEQALGNIDFKVSGSVTADSAITWIDAVRITSAGKVGIHTDIANAHLEIGTLTGNHMNTGGMQVNRPHSLGLSNGVFVYSEVDYNNTPSYNATAFKAVGTGGNAFGVSKDQGSNGLGGSLTSSIDFDGNAVFLGKVGIQTNNPTSGLQVNNFFRSQLVPSTLSQPLGANWATESAIVTRGDFGGGICLDDNGVAGYSIFTSGNGNNLHIRAGLVGQVPAEKLLINSDGTTDGKIKSLCQVVFYNVTQTQRDALTAQTGGVIYNTSTNKLQCWNGSSWNNLF